MRLVVLYGSQTGTAQDVAEQIWRESKRWGFTGPVLPMDEFPVMQLIAEQLVVFVVATTGDGDEPDNMKQTWKFLLKRSLPPQSLHGLQFACLGLGDSSYAKFNYAAKKLHKRLQQLGAMAVTPVGLCDDQHDHGYGAGALPWIAQLWQELQRRLAVQQDSSGPKNTVFKWHVDMLEETTAHPPDINSLSWPLKEPCRPFVLKQNSRVTAHDHFQDVRLLKFDFPADVTWHPGDVLQVHPANSDEQVANLFAIFEEHKLAIKPSITVRLRAAHADLPVPLAYDQPVTLQLLVKYIWDLSARPRQRVFELLALNCENELEKEKLEELTTAEGLDSLISYVNRPRRTILEVLQDFPHASAKLTLPILFELFSMIQVRSFSIASVPSSGSLDLLVAVVEYKTKLSKPRLGLCSNWFKSQAPGTELLGAIKKGTMILPSHAATPLVMVGPGTGIAPFRSIIQSLAYQQQQHGGAVGPIVVFFGCRNKAKDFHFCDDFSQWQSSKLVKLFVAFSRDQEQKIYVQHLIKENKDLLKDIIKRQNAIVLVAGSSKNMPKAVKEAFSYVLDEDEAYVEQLIKCKRYQEETWG